MNIKEAILILLGSGDKIVKGRTMLQKRLYLFEALTEGAVTNRSFGFSPHYYGPYSSLASVELDSLVASGLVDDVVEVTGLTDTFGQVVRHDYTLTDDGNRIAAELMTQYPRAASVFAQISTGPVGTNIRQISAAAKVHFILRSEERALSEEEISAIAKRLGWQLEEEQIRNVVHYLSDELGLLSVEKD